MATLNLGRIKPIFKGAYAGGTAYVVDDIVTSGNETFICILASTGNATSNATYWTKMAAKGTDGTDLTSTITTQGDVLYRDGSGLQRLAKGTAAQALVMNSGATAPEWGTISSGNFSVHAFDMYSYDTSVSHNGQTDYVDIAGGNTVTFTPASVNDVIMFNHGICYNTSAIQGCDVYLNLGTSATLGSGDTKLNYSGTHANYLNTLSDVYLVQTKQYYLLCSSLTPSTQYYVEQAGGVHTSAAAVGFGAAGSNPAGNQHRNWVSMTHFKKN